MPWLIARVRRLRKEPFGHAVDEADAARRGRHRSIDNWLANIAALGFEAYYPLLRELRPVPRREMTARQRHSNVRLMRPGVVPFLPQLVFVRDNGRVGALAANPGVQGLICVGEAPARISDVLIDRLRERERDGAVPGDTAAEYIFRPFRVGEQVRVVNGPFATLNGIVEDLPDAPLEEIDAATRLRLTVNVFGRPTPVSITLGDVARL